MKDLATGRVYISSQNHGYVIKSESIPEDIAEVSFINVNDRTIEGLNYKNKKSVLYSSIRKHVRDHRIRLTYLNEFWM